MNTVQRIDDNLVGGILRIDVDQDPARSHPARKTLPIQFPEEVSGVGYWIPNDNPWLFPDSSGMEEYYSMGHRQPWKFHADPVTGELWASEVGPHNGEELNLIEKGANYGWPYRVGADDVIDWDRPVPTAAEPSPYRGNLRRPVFSPERSEANSLSIMFVYRGTKFSELTGKVIVGDHGKSAIWGVAIDSVLQDTVVIDLPPMPTKALVMFEGVGGDIFMLSKNGTLRMLQATLAGPIVLPESLSTLGAFNNLLTLEPADGLIPYTVNVPLWSDGSLKKRWIAVPNNGVHDDVNELIQFDLNEAWSFPPGTVLIKHFEINTDQTNPNSTTRLETRFFVHNGTDTPYGITYRWNNAGTDAYLIDAVETRTLQMTSASGQTSSQIWSYPSRQQCMQCHNATAGFALGLKTHQINGDFAYPSSGITANQIDTWSNLNMFDTLINSVAELNRAPALSDISASAQDRVMGYLDANCAYCHQQGQINAAFDARYHLPLSQKGLINEPVQSVNSALSNSVVRFGDTLGSELWVRDSKSALDPLIMPPIARSIVDNEYLHVLTDWIMNGDSTVSDDVTALDIKVYLDGAFAGPGLHDALRAADLIPLNEPYGAIYGHVGQGGNETVSSFTLNLAGDATVVDWVMVELRHDVMPELVEETFSALLLSDGRVIDPQGGPILVPTINDAYHVSSFLQWRGG